MEGKWGIKPNHNTIFSRTVLNIANSHESLDFLDSLACTVSKEANRDLARVYTTWEVVHALQ